MMKTLKAFRLISAGFWLGAALMLWLFKEAEINHLSTIQEKSNA